MIYIWCNTHEWRTEGRRMFWGYFLEVRRESASGGIAANHV